jgi:hypothetical protein
VHIIGVSMINYLVQDNNMLDCISHNQILRQYLSVTATNKCFKKFPDRTVIVHIVSHGCRIWFGIWREKQKVISVFLVVMSCLVGHFKRTWRFRGNIAPGQMMSHPRRQYSS